MASSPDILLGEGSTRMHKLFEHLLDDVLESYKILESDKKSQHLRRAAVRNVFSFIEAVVHIIKYEIKSDLRLNRFSYSLTKKNSEVLFEEKIRNEETIPFFIPIDENIKKTFSLASKVWGLEGFNLNTNDEKYSAFLIAKEARNKLTHPRTFYDIQITSDDISNVSKAYIWVKSEFLRLIKMKVHSITIDLPPEVYDHIMGDENT
ncbi:hypothetical protein PTRA_b0018 [Pseudoalteromonas translucida KMM 520]|uniref:RiboL-PSP-HEPN domain-containing protein n=1 Tax=Pseudoalteromonas translucida KMM 520 TaxID=1315283 RepID=A0A0U2X7B4_9GAMM|nr:hypothetical protein [Pseudoalteromonas translucida]ALS34562.1 hypothetical protein PTRA_b0018 [Pseudoalteromonas translucida KMM 520]